MFKHELSLSQSVSLSDDSDGEADRRQAMLFKKFEIISPDEDSEVLKTRSKHSRAKSLPPPMHVCVHPPSEPPPDQGEGMESDAESSLDRKPSYLRGNRGSVSPDPYVSVSHTI